MTSFMEGCRAFYTCAGRAQGKSTLPGAAEPPAAVHSIQVLESPLEQHAAELDANAGPPRVG
jgi:hypothetical protein